MKQRLPWMAFLLLITGLIGLAIGADPEPCTSDGVVGSFGQDGELSSLTFTPNDLGKPMTLKVHKQVDDATNEGIQIYVTLDDECKDGEIKFDITPADKVSPKCTFNLKVDKGKFGLSYADTKKIADLDPSFGDPFQASFEVRKTGEAYSVHISNPVQGEVISQNDKVGKCFEIKEKNLTFALTAYDYVNKNKDCGFQLEMKGKYAPQELKQGSEVCKLIDCPGCTNPDSLITAPTSTSAAPTTTSKPGFPGWAIGVIVGGVVLLLIIIIAIVLVIILVILPKRRAAAAESNMEEGAPGTQPAGDGAGPEAEQPNGQDADPQGTDKPEEQQEPNKADEA